MPMALNRRRAILAALCLCLALGSGAAFKLYRDVRSAAAGSPRVLRPLEYAPLPVPAGALERWGGGQVEGVALSPAGLVTAGGFGVLDDRGDLTPGLPTLHATALALWRGRPVAGLAAGGLFLRREDHWDELRTGFGTLHVRDLQEAPGGELLIGAREGLFRAAWGAASLERLDGAPVRSLALGEGGVLVAGGEEGLRRIEAGRATSIPTPDPWVDWVGLRGRELWVMTPLGLARGPLEGAPAPALAPVPEGQGARAAAVLGERAYAVVEGRLMRFEGARAAEESLPAAPRRVFAVSGLLFADTDAGLYRRAKEGWSLARSRPASLPPGPAHVTALASLGSRVLAGLFDGGLAQGEPRAPGLAWSEVPGTAAWGVNALLPAGGSVYVASLRGAARFDGRRAQPLAGDADGAAFSLADTRGGVAVGYGQGLQLPGSRFLSAFHGLPGNQALALAPVGESLFVGTPSGLGAVVGGRVAWRVTAGEGKLPHPWVTALAPFGDGLYIGTYGGGVARRTPPRPDQAPPGAFEAFPETEGLKVNTGCLAAAGGRLYLGTDGRGLWRLSADGRRFEPLRLPLPSPRVTAILPVQDALLVGTEEGLARFPLSALQEGS